jgi:phage-related protein
MTPMEGSGPSGDDPSMPQIDVLLDRDDDGSVPAIDGLSSLQADARDRCLARLDLPHEHGHDLRRPQSENLGDGLYELRVRFYRVNDRMPYVFRGRDAAVVSHGLAKERVVPPGEIAPAFERKRKFETDPERHTFRREE